MSARTRKCVRSREISFVRSFVRGVRACAQHKRWSERKTRYLANQCMYVFVFFFIQKSYANRNTKRDMLYVRRNTATAAATKSKMLQCVVLCCYFFFLYLLLLLPLLLLLLSSFFIERNAHFSACMHNVCAFGHKVIQNRLHLYLYFNHHANFCECELTFKCANRSFTRANELKYWRKKKH